MEGAIGYVKQHYLWYSANGEWLLTTAHERMRPAFACTRATVAIPFGSRIVSTKPREHRQVVNGSFGDRFVEGIYLHADHAMPKIRMYGFGSLSEISVQDFWSYSDEVPFRDQSCLVRSSQNVIKRMLEMHAEDSADDALIAEELVHQAVTRTQTKAMKWAEQTQFVAPAMIQLLRRKRWHSCQLLSLLRLSDRSVD